MSFLDIYQNDRAEDDKIALNEGKDLPPTAGEAFEAAWNYGRLFSQSVAGENARQEALQDYIDEVKQQTGKDPAASMDWSAMNMGVGSSGMPADMLDQLNGAVQKINAGRPPDQAVPTLSDEDLQNRIEQKSRAAVAGFQRIQDYFAQYDHDMAISKIAGGNGSWTDSSGSTHDILQPHANFWTKAASYAGSIASAVTDPINLLAMPIAPEASLGVVANAFRVGGIAGASQAAIEAVGAPFHEEVQPGYLASGAPLANVAESAAGGAVLGAGARVLANPGAAVGSTVREVGAAFSGIKQGVWQTSIKDAGNVVESEANVLDHNVYPGAEGEAAHRDAMATGIDQVLKGEPVDVSKIITPDIEAKARDLTWLMEHERAPSLPVFNERQIALTSEEAGLRARDEELAGQAPEITDEHTTAADRLNRLQAVDAQLQTATGDARKALLERRDQILVDTTPEQLQADAAPIEQARRVEAERQQIGARLAEIEQERSATRAAALGAPEAIVGQRQPVRPAEVPTFEAAEPPTVTPPEQVRRAVESPEHQAALQSDIEREQVAEVGRQIPVDVDKDGNPIFRSIDDMQTDAEQWRKVAEQLAACASPVPEAA